MWLLAAAPAAIGSPVGAEGRFDMSSQRLGIVLLDVAAGPEEQFDVAFLERIDHPVTVCHGPSPGTVCPLLATGMCEKYASAHGIVFELDLDDAHSRAIVRRYRALNPDIPIRVVVSEEQLERYRELMSGVQAWLHEPSVAELDGFAAEVEAVDRSAEGVTSVPDAHQ
jgi:hypothetical protein